MKDHFRVKTSNTHRARSRVALTNLVHGKAFNIRLFQKKKKEGDVSEQKLCGQGEKSQGTEPKAFWTPPPPLLPNTGHMLVQCGSKGMWDPLQ